MTRKKAGDDGALPTGSTGGAGSTGSTGGAGGAGSSGSTTTTGIDPTIAALSYEDAVRELESLVASIEQGDVGLEASLHSYRRGEQLVRHCKQLLDKAECTVRTLSVGEFEREVE
jgi:exodeoxyribonuclease VII small subunit